MDLYPATLDTFYLQIETIDDAWEKAIIAHEFPYVDGALLEDMGQKARRVRFRCYWFEAEYEIHKDFLNHLESRELCELTHPKYGIMQGCIERVTVHHDDRTQTAEVDIEFLQQLITVIETRQTVDVQGATEQAWEEGQQEQMDAWNEDMVVELGAEGNTISAWELDPEQGILDQITGISTKARTYLAQVELFVSGCAGALAIIEAPASSLVAVFAYPATVAGRVVGALAAMAERYAVRYNSLVSSPARFLATLREGIALFEEGYPPFAHHVRIASAQRQALEAAILYKSDESHRSVIRRREGQKAFDVLGRYTAPEPAAPILTEDELETSLAGIRADLQAAVDDVRTMQSLKYMAETLLQYVSTIKLEREKMLTVEAEPTLPLHLLCLKHGISYQKAERIHSINRITHPSYTRGEVKIYAR